MWGLPVQFTLACTFVFLLVTTTSCMRLGRSDFMPVSQDLHHSASVEGAKTHKLRYELYEIPDMEYFLELVEKAPTPGQFIYRGKDLKQPISNHPVNSYNELVMKGFFTEKVPKNLAQYLDYHFLPQDYNFLVRLRNRLLEDEDHDSLKKLTELLEREYTYHLEKVAYLDYPLIVRLFKNKDDASSLAVKARLNLLHADLVAAAKRLGILRILHRSYTP